MDTDKVTQDLNRSFAVPLPGWMALFPHPIKRIVMTSLRTKFVYHIDLKTFFSWNQWGILGSIST